MSCTLPYKRPSCGLQFADKAAAFLDGTVWPDLENFKRCENYYLKPRIQDALSLSISEALEANELLPVDWQERVKLFRKARGRLKYLLILTDSAVSRHYLTPEKAAKWQGAIEELIKILCGLIGAAQKHKG